MKIRGARGPGSQPQGVILPRRDLWTPAGLWIPAYATRLWTPTGWLAPQSYTAGFESSGAGRGARGNGSTTLLNWAFPTAYTGAAPIVYGGVFTVNDASTTTQTAVGLGGSTLSTGLYGGVGQISGTAVDGWIRASLGSTDVRVSGPSAAAQRTYTAAFISRGIMDSSLWVNGVRYDSASSNSGYNDSWLNFSISGAMRATTGQFFGRQTVAAGFVGFADPGDAWLRDFTTKPWATLFRAKARRIWVPVGAGGTTYTATLTAAASTSAAIARAAASSKAATSPALAVAVRKTSSTKSAASTAAAALATLRARLLTLAATVGSSATVVRSVGAVRSATSAAAGLVTRSARAVRVAATPTAATVASMRVRLLTLLATVGTVGALTKSVRRTFAAVQSILASLLSEGGTGGGAFIAALRRYISPSRSTTLAPASRAVTFTSPARDDTFISPARDD